MLMFWCVLWSSLPVEAALSTKNYGKLPDAVDHMLSFEHMKFFLFIPSWVTWDVRTEFPLKDTVASPLDLKVSPFPAEASIELALVDLAAHPNRVLDPNTAQVVFLYLPVMSMCIRDIMDSEPSSLVTKDTFMNCMYTQPHQRRLFMAYEELEFSSHFMQQKEHILLYGSWDGSLLHSPKHWDTLKRLRVFGTDSEYPELNPILYKYSESEPQDKPGTIWQPYIPNQMRRSLGQPSVMMAPYKHMSHLVLAGKKSAARDIDICFLGNVNRTGAGTGRLQLLKLASMLPHLKIVITHFDFVESSSTNALVNMIDRTVDIYSRCKLMLVPEGDTKTSRRLYDALAAGIIPIIMSDLTENLPFRTQIDWSEVGLFYDSIDDAMGPAHLDEFIDTIAKLLQDKERMLQFWEAGQLVFENFLDYNTRGVVGKAMVQHVYSTSKSLDWTASPDFVYTTREWAGVSAEFLVDHKHNLAFCALPQVANAVTKTLFARIKANDPTLTRVPHPVRIESDFCVPPYDVLGTPPGACGETPSLVQDIVGLKHVVEDCSFVKTVMVRHPVTRFMSAAHSILYRGQQWDAIKWGAKSTVDVSIYDILKHMLENDIEDSNFMRQIDHCGMRHFAMDQILRVEHAQAETETYLRLHHLWDRYGTTWGVDQKQHIFQAVQSRETGVYIEQQLSLEGICGSIGSTSALELLNLYYKDDFDAFGYDMDLWINSCNLMTAPVPAVPIRVFIGVFSAPGNIEDRQTCRETWMALNWANSHYEFVVKFVIGKPVSGPITAYEQLLLAEERVHNDILRVDTEESYKNLVLKTGAMMKYAAGLGTQFDYVFKVDDDTFLNVRLLTMHIPNVKYDPADPLYFYWGNVNSNVPPNKDKKSKWYDAIFQGDRYPDYMQGPGYMLSMGLVKEIPRFVDNFVWLEDVSCGIWVDQVVQKKGLRREKYTYNVYRDISETHNFFGEQRAKTLFMTSAKQPFWTDNISTYAASNQCYPEMVVRCHTDNPLVMREIYSNWMECDSPCDCSKPPRYGVTEGISKREDALARRQQKEDMLKILNTRLKNAARPKKHAREFSLRK